MASNRKQLVAKFCRQEMVRLGHGAALGLPMVAQANIIGAAHGYLPNCTTKVGAREFLERLMNAVPLVIPAPKRAQEKSHRSYLERLKALQGDPGKSGDRTAEWVNSPEFLASYEWRSLRMKVLKTYGAACMCCGATRKDGVKLHVDHIKPRRFYPSLALEFQNLQVLCEACNHGKGNWDETDWR